MQTDHPRTVEGSGELVSRAGRGRSNAMARILVNIVWTASLGVFTRLKGLGGSLSEYSIVILVKMVVDEV